MGKEKKILAMSIDPSRREVLKIIEIENSLDGILKAIGLDTSGTFEIAKSITTEGTYAKESEISSWDLYIDGESLLKEDPKECFMMTDKDGNQISQILFGKGLILGTDVDGESVSVDPNEMFKIAKVMAMTKDHPNWVKALEHRNELVASIARGF
ncbi:MAG: hypothetical protein GY909_15680 [Oligoflexia bacterium]|nr:hypothetical protein [Oligoflexia bacterium]